MHLLPLLGHLGALLGLLFLTLSIASGLYYLSELVEEHTVATKRILTRLIHGILALHLLLWLCDGFPRGLTLFSACSHVVYLMNVTSAFPMVRLTDPIFILSALLVIANHFLWFSHFSALATSPAPPALHYTPDARDYSAQPSFGEIASFFGVCVWLVPFALFVSLSAAENVLPSVSEGGGGKRRREGMVKVLVGKVREWCEGTGQALGLWGEGGRRRGFD